MSPNGHYTVTIEDYLAHTKQSFAGTWPYVALTNSYAVLSTTDAASGEHEQVYMAKAGPYFAYFTFYLDGHQTFGPLQFGRMV